MLLELRHTVQFLEIDLGSVRNLKVSVENNPREVEACYTLQMEQLNRILLYLESELAQTPPEGQLQAQEYEAPLNIKAELEAEIATYHRLLEDGKDFNLVMPWAAVLHANHPKDHHLPESGQQSGA
ncbi:Keratin, type I cytoskeletal 18 [Saguinus oedipus]|uniref:Keratin, type I cytoskeletal 18 n=1 Tax=Saguinus oedipus TaxID=9490 RepID=A0ABQ9WAY4_SAGOE|nr:Keratin, type I cytoskeletal 18 [Saguinus oedipus]